MRAAHVRDGVALVRFLSWLDGREGVSELDVAAKLEAFRAESEGFLGLSFPTIAGSGPHGAIVHYKATAKSNRVLRSGEVLLIDSGGQYQEGTTDVTRTVVLGPPTTAPAMASATPCQSTKARNALPSAMAVPNSNPA